MASPQIEDGYTKIANELFEALAKIRINGEARQMLDVIIRKTYGYNKKEDMIATSQFQKATNLSASAIHKSRKKLLTMNLITVTQKGNSQVLTYCIQKDFKKWKVLPKKVTVAQKVIHCSPKGILTKETIQKKKDSCKQTDLKESFCKFYSFYPRKIGKSAALKAWLKLNPNDVLIEEIVKALELQKKQPQWRKDNGQYIPHPSTWLNQKRWEDEVETPLKDPTKMSSFL